MAEHRTWTEELRVAGDKAAAKVKELIREGNVRKVIIKKKNGEVIKEITLTQGVAVGGMLALVAPMLAAIGALLALLAEVRIEVVREGTRGGSEGGD